jgi:VanZ family protein
VARLFSRYFPLVAWLLFISFASSDNFNAGNTSRIIGPLILWLFPDTSIETLGLVHLITRKAAHFTEYAILAFFAARAFRTSPRPSIANRWFLISLAPSRTGTIYDSLIDIAGGLTALLLIRRRHKTARRFN